MSSCEWVDLNAVVDRLHIGFVAIHCHCHTSWWCEELVMWHWLAAEAGTAM